MNSKLKLSIDVSAILILFILIIVAVWLSVKTETVPERVKKIEKMKKGDFEISFTDLENNQYHLSDFQNSVVLINIWAPWCAPCIEELPSLLKLAQHFPSQLVIIALTDEPQNSVKRFFSSFEKPGKNFIVALSNEIKNIFSPSALPESYIFKNGKMSLKIIGPRNWDSLEWKNKINQLYNKESF